MQRPAKPTLNNGLRSSGITLLLLFFGSWCLTAFGRYHTVERDAGIAVGSLTAWLEILWMSLAGSFAILHWRASSWAFRVVLGLNGCIVAALLTEWLSSRT